MAWDDILAEAGDAFMDAFAEKTPVILRPGEGRPRSVKVIIDWKPSEEMTGGQPGSFPQIAISFLNHPFKGIDPAELDLGTWKVDVPIRKGEPARTRPFHRLISVDGGEVVVLVR
ncbi:MAG TPA: hypothetical protein VGN72_10090 [Tepidisphaeraceae bacterium]|jgi:hypothetical protein|nr:hypothetical protein [Tepidisphaeraceae bacterium]